MYEEMHYLDMTTDALWEDLPAGERELYAFVVERILVEQRTILDFFANDSDVGCTLEHG